MRYLVTQPHQEPFITQWFDPENNFNPGMIIYDLEYFTYFTGEYTWSNELQINKAVWIDIEHDHL